MRTESDEYAERLVRGQSVWWKRLLPVQAVYRWNLRRQRLGRTLDVGCGLGRNLAVLGPGSVGVDHNPAAVAHARSRGLTAVTTAELPGSEVARAGEFDALLLAHVVEHLSADEAAAMLRTYLPYLRPGGRVMFICPQERGFASDPTHVRWTTGEDLRALARQAGLRPRAWHSFPFPRSFGKVFTYNEFTLVAELPAQPARP